MADFRPKNQNSATFVDANPKKNFQNRFFSIFEKMLEMLSKHHIYVKKCFLMVLRLFFSHISIYIGILCNFLKIDIFAKNHDFDDFSDFLIFHDSADWPAGNGRNYDWYPKTYSTIVLKPFSYADRYCIISRSNFMILWKSAHFWLIIGILAFWRICKGF